MLLIRAAFVLISLVLTRSSEAAERVHCDTEKKWSMMLFTFGEEPIAEGRLRDGRKFKWYANVIAGTCTILAEKNGKWCPLDACKDFKVLEVPKKGQDT